MKYKVDDKGFMAILEGHIPEMLYPNIDELKGIIQIINSENFRKDFEKLLTEYVGRPTPPYSTKGF